MNGFVKKMCIIKQLKSGFSADGSPLSGVVRVESFLSRLTVQVSLINFAPIDEGKYLCVLCDRKGERLLFPLLSGIGEYKAENSPFDLEKGFCCLICFLHKQVECLAAGQYGGGAYSLRSLLADVAAEPPKPTPAVLPAAPPKPVPLPTPVLLDSPKEEDPTLSAPQPPTPNPSEPKYDDELLSEENYYEKTGEVGVGEIEGAKKTNQPFREKKKAEDREFLDDEAFPPFKLSDGRDYYRMVKEELEDLFKNKERSPALLSAFPHSEWVRIEDTDGCLIGKIYENLQIRYIAYALPATGKTPPKGMEKACFVPLEKGSNAELEGYFVLFQDCDTGECAQVNMI